jgi:hypothetical protein
MSLAIRARYGLIATRRARLSFVSRLTGREGAMAMGGRGTIPF